jgi:hypothetical protein
MSIPASPAAAPVRAQSGAVVSVASVRAEPGLAVAGALLAGLASVRAAPTWRPLASPATSWCPLAIRRSQVEALVS